MNKRQENKFTMYNAVNRFLEENSLTTGSIPELRENQIAFTAKCDEIKQIDDRKKTVAIGKTLSKLQARDYSLMLRRIIT
ncbi:MAG: hypothetical protein IPL53_17195 [Ignavibacteria bacterium]|nr:hypothetical protein [Ignavibacteria bacterium]